jgi:hypothetical protein
LGLSATTLGDVLEGLSAFDETLTIYAEKPWSCDSVAAVAPEGDRLSSGLSYLLEVSLAREVIETWTKWRSGRIPDRQQMCAAVVHYAIRDAFLEPEDGNVDR